MFITKLLLGLVIYINNLVLVSIGTKQACHSSNFNIISVLETHIKKLCMSGSLSGKSMVEKGQNYPANRRYCSAQVRTQTQLHSLFPYSDNPMGQLSDTTVEKSGARPTALHYHGC